MLTPAPHHFLPRSILLWQLAVTLMEMVLALQRFQMRYAVLLEEQVMTMPCRVSPSMMRTTLQQLSSAVCDMKTPHVSFEKEKRFYAFTTAFTTGLPVHATHRITSPSLIPAVLTAALLLYDQTALALGTCESLHAMHPVACTLFPCTLFPVPCTLSSACLCHHATPFAHLPCTKAHIPCILPPVHCAIVMHRSPTFEAAFHARHTRAHDQTGCQSAVS